MELPKRKPNRLKNYDYSENGAYFITICTKDKQCILGEIVQEKNDYPHIPTCKNEKNVGADTIRPIMKLSEIGKAVNHAINQISKMYENVFVDVYVVMPNHVHLIVAIQNIETYGRMLSAPTMSVIIGSMKRYVSKQIGFPIWQKSFHDHIIRNENEYIDIYNYVEYNAYNWHTDCFYIKSSPNTSFN